MTIEIPKTKYISDEQTFKFNTHVFNSTSGLILDNSTITCDINLYYKNGTIIFNGQMTSQNELFYYNLISSNLEGQEVSYLINCDDGNEGGFVSGQININKKGYKLELSEVLIYLAALLTLGSLLVLCIYGGLSLPFNNVRNQDDEVIQINWKKYLKIFCWMMVYYFLTAIVWLMWNLTYAFAEWDNLGIIFEYWFKFSFAIALPVFIGVWILILINFINDKKIDHYIKRMGEGLNA